MSLNKYPHNRGRRGRIQSAILYLLQIEPMHGYQIMKELEGRTDGLYSASAGTVYPALQDLVDKNLIEMDVQIDKKVYTLKEKGIELLGADPNQFWEEWRSHLVWRQSDEARMFKQQIENWEMELHQAKKIVMKEPHKAKELVEILSEFNTRLHSWNEEKSVEREKE